jgi:hypothetical protein
MPTKKNNYITAELDFAEDQLATWKQYVLDHPIDQLKDRIEWKKTKTGGVMPMVIASIEQQGKFIQETLQKYLALLEVVNNLREKEEAKVTARGGKEISSGMMGRFTKEEAK